MVDSKVRVVDIFPADSHPLIVYPMALTKGASAQATACVRYVRGAEAAAVFRKFGFAVLSP
jgi:molybdate transport system substrate-binding protein